MKKFFENHWGKMLLLLIIMGSVWYWYTYSTGGIWQSVGSKKVDQKTYLEPYDPIPIVSGDTVSFPGGQRYRYHEETGGPGYPSGGNETRAVPSPSETVSGTTTRIPDYKRYKNLRSGQ